jgi:DNA-binding transcriptional LysR family regulator
LLLPSIIDVLNAQATLLAKSGELRQPGKRVIRIGVSPLIGMEIVNLIVEPYRHANKNVEIIFREMNLIEMLEMLEKGQLEFVFGPDVNDLEKSKARNNVIFHEEPLVFIAKGADTQYGTSITLKEIAGEMFVMVPDSCGLAKVTRALFRQNRFKLKEYAGAAMSYRVLQEWAQLGIGAAILPRSKVAVGLGTDIYLRKGKQGRVTISYQACWQSGTSVTAEVKALGKYLRDTSRSIMTGSQGGAVNKHQ